MVNRAIQETAEETGDLIGNKIATKIAKCSETVIPKVRLSPKKDYIINNLRLI